MKITDSRTSKRNNLDLKYYVISNLVILKNESTYNWNVLKKIFCEWYVITQMGYGIKN